MISVLVVEDNSNKRDLILDVLKNVGVNIKLDDVVSNVQCALKNLALKRYDILILDLKLPIRKGHGTPRHDAGVKILQELMDSELFVPNSVFGLTSYNELKAEYIQEFETLDFHLYDTTASDDWMDALSKKIRWLNQSNKAKEITVGKKLIITVHGINTAGAWQDQLSDICISEPLLEYKNYKYIQKSPIKILFPFWRRKIVRKFEKDLTLLLKNYHGCEIYFFGHSFGTFIIAETLKRMSSLNTPNIEAIVFAGSVLKRDYSWDDIRDNHNVKMIINDCGIKDRILPLAYLFAPGLGIAGRTGFYSFDNDRVKNRFFDGGHSFIEKQDNFYVDYWLPIIQPELYTEKVYLDSPSVWQEKFLDITKIFIYFFVLSAFIWFLW